MKKNLIIIFVLSLMSYALTLAQDSGSGGNSNGAGGNQPKKHSKGNKGHKSQGGGYHSGGKSNSFAPHSFNNHNNSISNNHSVNPATNSRLPHHFGTGTPNQGRSGVNTAQGHAFPPTGGLNHSNRVPSNLKQMGIKQMPSPLNKSNLLTADSQHSSMIQPQVGPKGESLNAAVIAPTNTNAVLLRTHMSSINQNAAFSAQINIYNNQENVANHYYWHTWNGGNYCHYYDSWGYHWYGWYWGNTCFWSRWYGNNWWWYDPGYARWCYWYDGFWWWQDPNLNVVYVYNNGEYTSAANPGAPVSTNPSAEIDFKSNDGTRMVKVVGNDAFLYDIIDTSNNKPFYLASNVKDVEYSKTDNGQPLQIKLNFNDGTSETFDSDGNPVSNGSNAPSN